MALKISKTNQLIISAGVLLLTSAYVLVNNLSYTIILYIFMALAGLNVLSLLNRKIVAIIISIFQTVILTVFLAGYNIIVQNSQTFSIIYIALNITAIAVTHYLTYRYVTGRLWFNLTSVYILTDVAALLAIQNNPTMQPVYILTAYIIYFALMFIKTKLVLKNKIKPYIPYHTSENILSKKITKMLKNVAHNKKGSESITRYVLAGNKIIFTHEPSNLKQTKITTEGLFYGEENYSSVLEKVINGSLLICRRNKISKNTVLPVIVVHDYKSKKISQIEVIDSRKPDYTAGAVYVCSPEGLHILINSLTRKSTPKGKQNAEIKYKILKSETSLSKK